MAVWAIPTFSQIALLFLLINYNCAEILKSEENIELLDHDVVENNFDLAHLVESDGENHVRRTRALRSVKSLKIRLEWFDKKTDALVGKETSRDLGDDGTVIEQLGMSIENNVNNGGFDVQPGWVGILQPYFKHRINQGAFDYQVAFDYREWWEDMRVISFELFKAPNWRSQNNNIYVNLTPDVTGEIVRATFQYIGHNDPSTMIRIHLLGTSFDAWMNTNKESEFFPTQKQLVSGRAFEVSHSKRATKTRHDSFTIGKALQVKLTFTVRVKT